MILPKEEGQSMTAQERIVEVLGGAKSIGLKRGQDETSLTGQVRAGLRFSALEALQRRYQITAAQIRELIDISERTLARRKIEKTLSKAESDRLYRVARIAAYAEDVLGSAEAATAWLKEPIPALGHVTPLSLLDTDEGSQHVTDILGRIEHGVYS
jgi:putative toxin-antitoxin system antitoxin component (TIGR02293 family)